MTAPPDDYADAHVRHWEDAELLFDNGRWPNADQLYGLSAECGLKKVLESMDVPIEDDYWAHVDQLWEEFCSVVEAKGKARYAVEGDPFSDWSIGQRYAHGRRIGREKAQRHREGAEQVVRVMKNAMEDGIL